MFMNSPCLIWQGTQIQEVIGIKLRKVPLHDK